MNTKIKVTHKYSIYKKFAIHKSEFRINISKNAYKIE